MRLRLVHTLSVLLAAMIFTAVLALGGLLAWNLRTGFDAYLAARDDERLERFAALLSERVAAAGGAAALADGAHRARGVQRPARRGAQRRDRRSRARSQPDGGGT